MKLAAFACSMLALLARPAEAQTPVWCSAIGDNRVDASGELKRILEDDDARNALKDLVGASCKPDGEQREHMKEIVAARDKWSKRLELTEADWSDVAAYATLGQGDRMNGEVRINTMGQEMGIGVSLKRAWSSFDALDQWAMINADAGASGDLSLDKNYLADALGGRLTETGRLAYIRRCIRSEDKRPVQWAMCQGDIDQLDWKKLGSELRENKAYSGADKIRVRIEADKLKAMLTTHAARVKKLVASDPGYAKMFELAQAARKEWEGRVRSDAALIELALAMDDARALNSRKAWAGCPEKTWAAWKSAMATIPAKKFEGMHDEREKGKSFVDEAMGPIINSPSVYLASVAFSTCMTVGQDRQAEHDILVRLLGESLQRWPGFRGPRTATHSAILGAGITLDDRDARIEYPDVGRPFSGGSGSRSGGGSGVVAKLKPTGKLVNVEFKRQMVQQRQCAQTKTLNRITQIRGDGTLVYAYTCTKYETVTVDKSDSAQNVNPRYLEGVKPGMFVSVIEDVAVAAWAKPGAAIPTMVFGVALK